MNAQITFSAIATSQLVCDQIALNDHEYVLLHSTDLPHPLCASSHSFIQPILDTGIAVGLMMAYYWFFGWFSANFQISSYTS